MALRPDADVTVNGWRNESGGTTLYASLNETTSNDATYIQSSDNPTDESFEVALSNPSGTPTNGPFKYRIFKKFNNAAVVNMKVALMQGATEIASWLHTDISNTPTEYSQTLTGPQFAAITDFTDLRIRGTANPTISATLTVGGTATLTGDAGTTLTFTGLSFPSAAAGRVCGFALSEFTGGGGLASAVSIDGGSATQLESNLTGGNVGTSIWGRAAAAGTSLNVVLTVPVGTASRELHVASFVLLGASSMTPSDTKELANTAAAKTITLTVPTGGVAFALAANNGEGVFDWTSGVEDFDVSLVSGNLHTTFGHASGTGSQTLTATDPANPGDLRTGIMGGAAWGP